MELVQVEGIESVPVGVTNRRHADSLSKAREELSTALDSLRKGATNEFIAFDVRPSDRLIVRPKPAPQPAPLGEAEHAGGLGVDDQCELGRLRQV